MANYAPIAIFCYRRVEHLMHTLYSLQRCHGFDCSPIFVFCDGPRDEREKESVIKVQEMAFRILGENTNYFFSSVHKGLSQSIVDGINIVLNIYDRIIVIEDDLELNEYFLTYMNSALDHYVNSNTVFQVSGYMFDAPEIRHNNQAVFLPFTVSWGWGTWKRAWQIFDLNAHGWQELVGNASLRHKFNLDGNYDFSNMLILQMIGERDSWAVRWYWSVYKMNGLVLYPPASLVRNLGFDGSGTHGRGIFRKFSMHSREFQFQAISLPKEISVQVSDYTVIKNAIAHQNGSMFGRFIDIIRLIKTRYLYKIYIYKRDKSSV